MQSRRTHTHSALGVPTSGPGDDQKTRLETLHPIDPPSFGVGFPVLRMWCGSMAAGDGRRQSAIDLPALRVLVQRCVCNYAVLRNYGLLSYSHSPVIEPAIASQALE